MMNVVINKYRTVSSYLIVSMGLIDNKQRSYFLVVKILVCKMRKNENKNWHPFFFFFENVTHYSKISVKITNLT